MKTLFTAILFVSTVISAPVFADDAKEVLAGNAAELSSAEMQTTEGAGRPQRVQQCCASSSVRQNNDSQINVSGSSNIHGSSSAAGHVVTATVVQVNSNR